jgi:hypothetical protein
VLGDTLGPTLSGSGRGAREPAMGEALERALGETLSLHCRRQTRELMVELLSKPLGDDDGGATLAEAVVVD